VKIANEPGLSDKRQAGWPDSKGTGRGGDRQCVPMIRLQNRTTELRN